MPESSTDHGSQVFVAITYLVVSIALTSAFWR